MHIKSIEIQMTKNCENSDFRNNSRRRKHKHAQKHSLSLTVFESELR